MEKINDSGSAFACAAENGHQMGMSMRDYFAGQALVGLLAAHKNKIVTDGSYHSVDPIHECNSAYRFADAMLRARGQ